MVMCLNPFWNAKICFPYRCGVDLPLNDNQGQGQCPDDIAPSVEQFLDIYIALNTSCFAVSVLVERSMGAELGWLVIGSQHRVMVYSDHDALKGIMEKGQTEKGRISNQIDRLGEYDFKLYYRASRDQRIDIADGLSRMPTRLSSIPKTEDKDRMAMAAIAVERHTYPNSVDLVGLGLGGGHGRLEGLYGVVGDGFVHLNVVLANGSEVGVKATSHEDLFWAMIGAGHNFGIVTSFRVKIYPQPTGTWHYHSYIWTQDNSRLFSKS